MKQILLVTAMCAAALYAPAVASAEGGVNYPDRQFYGFFTSNHSYTNGTEKEYGFAKQTFGELQENELIYRFGNSVGLFAATSVDGVYYGMPYQYTSSLEAPKPLPMFRYNLYNGMYEEVGPWFDNSMDTNFKVSDMTYDSKHDRLLALGYSSSTGSVICEVDRETGKLSKIFDLALKDSSTGDIIPGGVIAADAFGRVFVISTSGTLFQVVIDGNKRVIKLLDTDYQGLINNQSMEFDKTDNKLYWAANTLSNPKGDRSASTWLIEFTMPAIGPDVNYKPSDKITYVNRGEIGEEASFSGLYIPNADSFDAPGFITDTSFLSLPYNLNCTLTFKAPVKTFGGEDLESLDGFDVYRNGKLIGNRKGIIPGEEYTFFDNDVPDFGEYRYDILCYSNTKGNGPKSPIFAYVGNDKPEKVKNLKVDVADNFLDITISWDAPETGNLGGAIDPEEVRYDILRLPDNVKIAENISETTYTDKLKRLLRYSYQVTAHNEIGGTKTESSEFIAGKPVTEFPVDETFDNPTATLLKWTQVDNNNDGQSWIYGADYSHSIYGDYEMAANYILSPTSIDPGVEDADEWLISPPIQFGDDDYTALIEIRSMFPETLRVYTGQKNTVEDMELIQEFRLRQPEYNEDGRMIFNKYYFKLPASVRNKIACFGLQLATPLPGDLQSMIQIGAITIDSTSEISGVGSIEAEKSKVSFDSRSINISGNIGYAVLYSANGSKVMTVGNGYTDISGLASGVYILSVDGKSYKIAR